MKYQRQVSKVDGRIEQIIALSKKKSEAAITPMEPPANLIDRGKVLTRLSRSRNDDFCLYDKISSFKTTKCQGIIYYQFNG